MSSRNDFNLADVYSAPKEPWSVKRFFAKSVISKIGFSILCTVIASTVMNLPYLKLAVLWCCKITLMVFGTPDGKAADEKGGLKDKLEIIVAKGKEMAGQHDDGDKPHVSLKEKVAEKLSSAATAPVREAAAKVHDKVEQAADTAKEKVAETRDTVKTEAKKVTDKLDNLGGGIADKVHEKRQSAAEQLVQARREEIERQAKAKPKYGPSRKQQAIIAQRRKEQGVAKNAISNDLARGYGAAAATNARNQAAAEAEARRVMGIK